MGMAFRLVSKFHILVRQIPIHTEPVTEKLGRSTSEIWQLPK